MANLLNETIGAIADSGHTIEDVAWVGTADREYAISWDEFAAIADVEYSAGFGCSEVATDLAVVFHDGKKMWRGEYDGSEWWEFDAPVATLSGTPKPFTAVVGMYWPKIEYLMDPADDHHRARWR